MSKLYDASDLIKLFTKLEGKFEDLKWKVKQGNKYVDAAQPLYTKSLTASESLILI